jgi:uncharacterized RDD family membrane protein YckC
MANCPTCGTEEVPGQQFCGSCGSPTTNANLVMGMSPMPNAYPTPMPQYVDSATANGYVLAGFWKRFLGFFIDGLLLYAIADLPLRLTNAGTYTSVVVVAIVTFLYGSLFIGYGGGQTLGMRAVSIRCVDEDGVSLIDYQRAVRRAIAYGVLTVIPSLYHYHLYKNPTTLQMRHESHEFLIVFVLSLPHFIDLLWVAWDKRNQTLHDKFAHSVVIKTN